ncbi:MAG: transcription elongation factor GreB [Gammaproteobacteria bacterium]
MGRWRPPPEKSSPYITGDGYRKLQLETQDLWTRRAEVTRALTAAAAEGDRSENAEYIYRKKELRELDRRIRYLQKRLPELRIVDQAPSEQNQVFFGAEVVLEDKNGAEHRYRIVGPDEIDTKKNWISVDAPLAKALLKKKLDEEITVEAKKGTAIYLVVGITYPD